MKVQKDSSTVLVSVSLREDSMVKDQHIPSEVQNPRFVGKDEMGRPIYLTLAKHDYVDEGPNNLWIFETVGGRSYGFQRFVEAADAVRAFLPKNCLQLGFGF